MACSNQETIVSGTSRTPSIISSVFTSKAPTITDESQLYSLDGDPKSLNEKPVRIDFRVSTTEQSIKDIPYHVYGRRETLILVFIVSVAASLSGLSSNVYFPAMVNVAEDLHISYSTVNLSITTYLIAQGLAPSFWGPLADFYGRRTIFVATLTLYLISNIALALVQNATMLLVFRAIQAAGSSSTISLGAGVITDIASPEKRGGYQGTFSGARQFSIAVGPVIGGVLAGTLGYRAIFWFLVILAVSVMSLIILLLPETLRRIAGNGCNPSSSIRYAPMLSKLLPYCNKEKLLSKFPTSQRDEIEDACENIYRARGPFTWKIFIEPMKMLLEKDVACALTFGACSYTAWSMMTSQTTAFLTDIYGFSIIEVGIAFLANGLGCVCGSYLSGKTLNKTYRRESSLWRHVNGLAEEAPIPRPAPPSFPIERARLSEAPFYSAIQILGLLIFGWSLTSSKPDVLHSGVAHWITPLLAQFAVGYANTAVLNSNSTFIADLYPGRSASASAVLNLTRNLMAAVGVSVADYISAALSPGWYGTVLAGVVVVGLVPNVLHSIHGPGWRERRQSSVAENMK